MTAPDPPAEAVEATKGGPLMITIELSRDGWSDALQLSINHVDADGTGEGYRIFGPKFNGSSALLKRHVLDERDVTELRAYLDRFVPTGMETDEEYAARIQNTSSVAVSATEATQ